MTNKETVDKVKKLLALANDTAATEEEAKTAMLMAQKLMAKEDIDEDDLGEDEKQRMVMRSVFVPKNPQWCLILADVIAKNFKCEAFQFGTAPGVHFLGYEGDVEVCVQVFEYARKICNRFACREVRKYEKWGENTNGVYYSYCMGFMVGVKSALDRQCKALMIITPPEIKQQLQKWGSVDKKVGRDNDKINKNIGSYMNGVVEGQKFIANKETAKAIKA